ncbi:unnamed protein product [Larinioides sclopetarius]|uniref:Uncharacterized protein n=1 Tax=Larinioides sclopetarius TaxID=280406 RepID=A0AAV1YX29_9ARAC
MAAANTIQMERFAFDVFVDSLLRFKLKVVIPPSNCSKNTYEHPDFLLVLSRGYIAYQLRKRDIWRPKFEAVFKSNRLKKFKQVSNLLEELLEEMDREPRTPMDRIVTSLAVINELIQFLNSKHRRLFLNDLASLWTNYFAGFEKEFEEEGGLAHLYSIHCGALQVSNKILDDFILKWCDSYENAISFIFDKISLNPQSLYSLEKQIDEVALRLFSSSSENKLLTASRSPRTSRQNEAEASDSLVNTGLGITQHEDLLRDYSPFADESTSPEKPNATSIEETSANPHADLKLRRKQSEQRNRKLSEKRSQPSIQITSPEGQSKTRGALARSSLSPEGQSKERGALARSSLSPEGQSKERGALARSSLSPEGQSKERGALARSSLSPEGQSKERGALARSSLSPAGQSKERGALARSSLSPAGQSKERGTLARSSLSPEGQSKERAALSESPLSPEEQPKGRKGSTGSPSSEEQKLRRSSPRTPEGTSRLEQKRQKYRQLKKSEPTN